MGRIKHIDVDRQVRMPTGEIRFRCEFVRHPNHGHVMSGVAGGPDSRFAIPASEEPYLVDMSLFEQINEEVRMVDLAWCICPLDTVKIVVSVYVDVAHFSGVAGALEH
jgi:hypothetical protein